MMRVLVATFLAFGLAQGAMADEIYSDPKSLVSAIYAAYQPGHPVADPAPFYSAKLKTLVTQHQDNAFAKATTLNTAVQSTDITGENGPFNPFLPDSSALISDLVISEPTQIGDKALVNVSFHNFDHPRLLSIALVKEGDGWKVDDVASVVPDDHWLLSWALAYDPQDY